MNPLVCASCGGPLPEEAARQPTTCAFCGAANVPPPAVIEHVVERVVVLAPKGESSDGLHCPRCAVALTNATSGAVVVHGCADCGGIWLDPRAVNHARDVNDEDLLRVAFSIVGPVVRSRPDKTRQICCPVCARDTRRVAILGGACEVDVCGDHGTWFDRTELDSFVHAHSESRAGEITEDDLRAAGVSGTTDRGDIGFFGAALEVAGLFAK